jgi:hypothetical protein
MAIISFDRDAVIDYIPEYAGNRNSDTPCVVMLRFVPYSRVQHYARVIAARARALSDPTKAAEVAHEVQKKQFVENVEMISGYFVGDEPVTDPGEFYDTADTELVTEIIKAMESHAKLTEGQRKN